ncbi:hypothetical protein BaRGS_00016590, partial [Batillaria attramentaria]
CPSDFPVTIQQGEIICYYFSNSSKLFEDAKTECSAQGGILAEPKTADANNFLKNYIQTTISSYYWSRWLGITGRGTRREMGVCQWTEVKWYSRLGCRRTKQTAEILGKTVQPSMDIIQCGMICLAPVIFATSVSMDQKVRDIRERKL